MTDKTHHSTAPSHPIGAIFLHHSTGANLIQEGNARTLFRQQAPFIDFWDHGYDPSRVKGMLAFIPSLQSPMHGLRNATGRLMPTSFRVPNNNTDPDGLAELFSQPVTNPPTNALSHLLQFDVVIFKSCFPVTAIASNEQLQTYQKYYLTIRNTIDRYPEKLFIPMTPPPLRASMTNTEQAKRARQFANWMMSEEYHGQRSHLKPYDFFDQLATPEGDPQANTLRPEFCPAGLSDSHPNTQANSTVAPHWISFVIETVKQTTSLTTITT
jgi:hypothetical protein